MEALEQRHSVRQYEDKPINEDLADKLNTEIDVINK